MTAPQESLQHEAERLGLTKLAEKYLAQLAKAKDAADRMVAAMPRHLHPYDEPAHTFRASKESHA